jgi:hypothetical protein
MHQIDAATALKIFVDAAPEGTAEPTLKAIAFIEHDARSERIHIEGFRSSSALPEPVPVAHICALEFDWLARPSKVDDERAEADLVAPKDARALRCECVWHDLRFSRKEIEAAAASFATLCQGRQVESDAPPSQRKRRQSMQAEVEQFLTELYKDGSPEWWDWPHTRFDKELRKLRNFGVGIDTIKRARRAVTQASK